MLVARAVATAPAERWRGAAIELWRTMREQTGDADLTWTGASLRAGELHATELDAGPADWPRIVDAIRAGAYDELTITAVTRRGGEVALQFAAELYARLVAIAPSALQTLTPGFDRPERSDHQPRAVSAAVQWPLALDGPDAVERIVESLLELCGASDALWADAAVVEVPPGTFRPAARGPAEWRPLIARQLPGAAWLVMLGAGHVEALGGRRVARRALAEFTVRKIGSGLFVRTSDRPAAADDPSVLRLGRVLTPVTMPPPLDPEPVLLVPPDLSGEVESDMLTRRLADGTVAIAAGTGPINRGDPVEHARLSVALERMYDTLDAAGVPARGVAPPLHLPRLLGARNYLRLGTGRRPNGIVVWDGGEPLPDPVPIRIVTGRRATGSAFALEDAMRGWAATAGAQEPTIRWTPDGCELAISRDLTTGEPLLLLILAVDRWLSETSRSAAAGMAIGPIPDLQRLAHLWRQGHVSVAG